MIRLRPYQLDCIAAVEDKFTEGRGSLLVTLPTGGGKTIIFAELARRRLPSRTLVIAHREELISQACSKINAVTRITPGVDMAKLASNGSEEIVVASIQTLSRGRDLPGPPFDLMVIDEAHHAAADSYTSVIERLAPRHLLGFTATPYRGDKKSLAHIFEDQAFSLSILDLIKQGYLADIRVKTLPVRIDLSRVRIQQGDFSESDLGDALVPMIETLADIIVSDYRDRKLLAFCPLRDTSRLWTQALAARGLPAAHVDGESQDRKDLLRAFCEGQVRFLSNASLLTEGYDEPSIDTVLILRPTKSRGLFSQMLGRGTRLHSGKPHLLVLDPIFQAERHDVISVADVAAEDQVQAKRTAQIMRERDSVLTEAMEIEAQERHDRLAEVLKSKARRESYDRRLAELAFDLNAGELTSFEPVFHWQREAPSEKQLQLLKSRGVPADVIHTKGHASAIIDQIMKRQNQGLATLKQVRYMRQLGHERPEAISFNEASEWIGARRSR